MPEAAKVEIAKPTERPRYRLIKPFYVDDIFINEEEEIFFDGVPNEAMEPMNEPALKKVAEFRATLPGGKTPPLETTVAKAMAERPREVTVVGQRQEVPLMGNLNPDGSKLIESSKPSTVEHIPKPVEAKYVRPIRPQGTVPGEDPTLGGI